MKRLLSSAVLIALLCSTAIAKDKNSYPVWIDNTVFYQIYPQSFKDSNGDGIGDLRGIISKLDYIKNLGVGAIWLNPCFESPFLDAGYDVSNYYKVAPRYGTNKDMKALLRKAHELNIKVILDLVAGHTSIEHKWFKESSKSAKGKYANRYIWTNDKNLKPKNFVSGSFKRNGTYLKNFFETQPALNYGYANPNPNHSWEQATDAEGPKAMRDELKSIIAYWMNMGVDGFRVDMASSLVKEDVNLTETDKLWGDIRSWFSVNYPDGVLIAEWGNPEQAIRAGFVIDFMMHFGVKGYPYLFFEDKDVVLPWNKHAFFSPEGKGDASAFVDIFIDQQKKIDSKGVIALPSSNHDFQRLRSGSRQNEADLKVAMAFLCTWQSIPFIYYGDEIGMKYIKDSLPDKEGSVLPADVVDGIYANRAGSRTPMQWDETLNAGFSRAAMEKLYLPIDPDRDRPNVSKQNKDSNSMLNFMRKLIELRNGNPALGCKGKLEMVSIEKNAYPLIYKRSLNGIQFLICLNPKDSAVTIEVNETNLKPELVQNVSIIENTKAKTLIKMQGVSFGIYRIN